VPTWEEIKSLRYCQQVIFETLRLYPTVPSFPRYSVASTKLGPYDIPRGCMVYVTPGAMNHDPELWVEPTMFRPERFDELPDLLPGRPVGVPGGSKYGFLPFGAGPRTCVGQRLAMMEAVQILGAVTKRYQFALRDEHVEEFADITLGPKRGMYLRPRLREAKKGH